MKIVSGLLLIQKQKKMNKLVKYETLKDFFSNV